MVVAKTRQARTLFVALTVALDAQKRGTIERMRCTEMQMKRGNIVNCKMILSSRNLFFGFDQVAVLVLVV